MTLTPAVSLPSLRSEQDEEIVKSSGRRISTGIAPDVDKLVRPEGKKEKATKDTTKYRGTATNLFSANTVQLSCASIILTRRFCLHRVRAVALLIYIITGKFYKAVWSAQSYLETYKCHIFWIVLYTLVLFGIFAERFYCKFTQCCYPIRLA